MGIVTIKLYDSRAQRIRDFSPITPGKVSIYVCGPTVQSEPHIGHLRSGLVYDIMRRWFEYRDYDVTLIRNVTDVDDKILSKAAESGEQWWALAYRMEAAFDAAYAQIGVRPPTYAPRATGSIQQMQNLIAALIERGHAYQATDGSADVYFDTASWPSYGALTHQSLDDMVGESQSLPGKRAAHDFALWKATKPGEPTSASWASPWGPGRPGWHIECSAMSAQYLGDEFDIHGGGRDLRFPHHENELAQSEAAGKGFARMWIHNGLVSIGDQKISKSLGNSVFISDLLELASPMAVRYFLSSAQYRSTLDYSEQSLLEASAAWDRIVGFIDRAERRISGTRFAEHTDDAGVPAEFAAAMDDDLSMPQALAVLHDTVRAGNQALDSEELGNAVTLLAQVSAMVAVLGLIPEQAQASDASAVDALVQLRINERTAAKQQKDYAAADAIRDELLAIGIELQDTQDGVIWSFHGETR